MSDIISTIAGIGMAVGPPLIYVDQAYSIHKKRDSSGFSWDVCGVILIANIIRIFFWLGERFELPLLFQSLLLILAHLFLLSLCLHYAPFTQNQADQPYASLPPAHQSPTHRTQALPGRDSLPEDDLDRDLGYDRSDSVSHQLAPEGGSYVDEPIHRDHTDPDLDSESGRPQRKRIQISAVAGPAVGRGSWTDGSRRPFDFWQWEGMGTYLEFLAGLVVVLGILQVILGRWGWYIDALGFVALTIESTLPIPQFISNYRRKSTYGLRASTLAGWTFGDLFKTGYFFIRKAPLQFKVTAIMTVCFDLAVVAQRYFYGNKPPAGSLAVADRHEDGEAGRLRGHSEER